MSKVAKRQIQREEKNVQWPINLSIMEIHAENMRQCEVHLILQVSCATSTGTLQELGVLHLHKSTGLLSGHVAISDSTAGGGSD